MSRHRLASASRGGGAPSPDESLDVAADALTLRVDDLAAADCALTVYIGIDSGVVNSEQTLTLEEQPLEPDESKTFHVALFGELAVLKLCATHGIRVPRVFDFHSDDLQTVGPRPLVVQTRIPVDIDDKNIVIVDDVLYTGRTIRAALDELADFGRPRRIALAVLIDRGGRELPIQPDIVGKTISLEASQRVDVLVEELDGRNAAIIAEREAT